MKNADAEYIRAMKNKEVQSHNDRLEKIACELETIKKLKSQLEHVNESFVIVTNKYTDLIAENNRLKKDSCTITLTPAVPSH